MNPTLTAAPADFRLGLTSQNHEISVDRLPVTGRIPAWLVGTLLRNGPGRFEVGADQYRHWFDGLAMIHRFGIADGGVSYANRFLRTPGFEAAEREGHIVCSEFDTDPKRSMLGRLFNAPPASIFMGDTGSLALGGMLGSIAVAVKHEIVLAVIGGLFVLEAVSVIVQVASFKLTGKRIFRMAPIHHHFEQLGWTEPQIVIRFWIISVMLALAGLSTLKLR